MKKTHSFHYIIRETFTWIIAILISLFTINLVLFLYYRPSSWINRTNSSTTSIWMPNSHVYNALEGLGYINVDQNGYTNPNLPLGSKYCLVLGSSFTQGKEVLQGQRYTDILNKYLTIDDNHLYVYNCSMDGNYFPSIVNDFRAITSEFPDSNTIIIEINNSGWDNNALEACLNQHPFDITQTGPVLISNTNFYNKVKLRSKEVLPLYSVFKKQSNAIKNYFKINHEPDFLNSELNECINYDYINNALNLIRAEYNGNIIIIYHPSMQLLADGSLSLISEIDPLQFNKLCLNNNIIFIDTSDAFIKLYYNEHKLPYGFNNTYFGNGHFNKYGHQIMADELYQVIKRF